MNHERPHAPLLPSQTASLILDAADFAKELPAEQQDSFLRNVVTAVAVSLLTGVPT
jgi:hypothetical protein